MGRARLKTGQPCRYGHPWNRTPDGKRCLTCYPNTVPYEDLPENEKQVRDERGAARYKRWAEQRAECAARAREQRRRNHTIAPAERNRRDRRNKDFVLNASVHMRRRAGPHVTCARAPELRELWRKQDGRCGLTGALIPANVRPHLDHIVPLCAGGSCTVDNLHWTHPMANRAKNDSTVAEFHAWLDSVVIARYL